MRPSLEALERCLEERILLEALILFGSRARGDALEESDWDLAVVSSEFEDMNPVRRGFHLVDCVQPGIELVFLTPSELLRPTGSYLRSSLLEEGRPLVDRGAFATARFRFEELKASGPDRIPGLGRPVPVNNSRRYAMASSATAGLARFGRAEPARSGLRGTRGLV